MIQTVTFSGHKKAYQAGLPLIIFLLYLLMSFTPDLRKSVPEWIGLSAVIIILLSLILFFFQSIQYQWSAGLILFVAAILRALFLWRSPELSDDIYRYLFDGQMLLSGRNPYTVAPADMLARLPLMSTLISRINHADLPTIYPPAAQLVFAAGAIPGSISGMKMLLILLDLSGCALILRLLDRLRLPRNNAVIYAWHPLPVIEIAASGHIDGAAILFTFLALIFLLAEEFPGNPMQISPVKNRTAVSAFSRPGLSGCAAGVFFSLALLTKWVPLIFLPALLLLTTSGKRKYTACGFLVTTAIMTGLFWPAVQNAFHTLAVYVANWEFSGFVFRRLRSAAGSGTIARWIIAVIFATAFGIIWFRCVTTVRRRPLSRDREVFRCADAIVILFLFLTPTLHPWYALYLVAFLPFAARPVGIVFSWSVLLAYRVVILYAMTGQWIENDFIPFLILIAPAAAYTAGILLRPATRRATGSDKSVPGTS